MIIKKKNAKPKQAVTEEKVSKIETPKPSPVKIPEPQKLPEPVPEKQVEEILNNETIAPENIINEPENITEITPVVENTQETIVEPEPVYVEPEPEPEPEPAPEPEPEEEVLDLFEGFDLQNIDFSQRQERRRGDRRRGYRRVDDRNLVSRAQAEAIAIKEKAYQEGFNSGLMNAQDTIDDLKDSIAEFIGYKQEIYDKMCDNFLDLSVKIAEKIIKKEVKSGKSVLKNIIMGALEDIAKGETKIILKVAPSDVEYTKELVPGILSTGQIEAKIYVTGDDKVEEGSVIIETSNGLIDANIDTQLEVIKEAFKQISSSDDSLQNDTENEEDEYEEDEEDDDETDDTDEAP